MEEEHIKGVERRHHHMGADAPNVSHIEPEGPPPGSSPPNAPNEPIVQGPPNYAQELQRYMMQDPTLTYGQAIQRYMIEHQVPIEHPGLVTAIDHTLGAAVHGAGVVVGSAASAAANIATWPWRHTFGADALPPPAYYGYPQYRRYGYSYGWGGPYGVGGGMAPYTPVGGRTHEAVPHPKGLHHQEFDPFHQNPIAHYHRMGGMSHEHPYHEEWHHHDHGEHYNRAHHDYHEHMHREHDRWYRDHGHRDKRDRW